MLKKPAISVVLPTYNRAAVLSRAMRSVLAQTYSDLELIVVDDGSTDDSVRVVRAFDDPRVRYIAQEHSGSAAITRNIGIRASRAPLIAFQDSDDEWLIGKLARQTKALQAAGSATGLVCGGYIVVTRDNRTTYVGADRRMQAGDWGSDNIYDFRFIAPTWLIRRETLEATGLFDEAMLNLEDWELAFRLFRDCRIVVLDEPLVLKHGGADSLNAKPQSRIPSLARIINRHGEIWQAHPEVLARLYEEIGRWQCRNGDVRQGRTNLWRSLQLDPGSSKRWGLWFASMFGANAYKRMYSLRRRVSR